MWPKAVPGTLKCLLGKHSAAHLWRHLAKPPWFTDLPNSLRHRGPGWEPESRQQHGRLIGSTGSSDCVTTKPAGIQTHLKTEISGGYMKVQSVS